MKSQQLIGRGLYVGYYVGSEVVVKGLECIDEEYVQKEVAAR